MISLKKKPDLEFFILLFVLVGIVFLASFKIELLCLNEYDKIVTVRRGIIEITNTEQVKTCYPVYQYFKERKKLQNKLKKQEAELITQISSSSGSSFNLSDSVEDWGSLSSSSSSSSS